VGATGTAAEETVPAPVESLDRTEPLDPVLVDPVVLDTDPVLVDADPLAVDDDPVPPAVPLGVAVAAAPTEDAALGDVLVAAVEDVG
jgi:hypothetical protein